MELQYDIGKTVWLMRSNDPHIATIVGRQYTEIIGEEATETYLVRFVSDCQLQWEPAGSMHPSKDALIAALVAGA